MKGNTLKIGLLLIVLSTSVLAKTKTVTPTTPPPVKSIAPNIASIFQNADGCFMLYNNNTQQLIQDYNPQSCKTRVSPCSTFKVALSLMAFDQKIITQNTIFKWDGIDKGLPQWNHDQTPYTWLKNSVVWVSQSLTHQLGMRNIQFYLHAFNYGNQNFSGDPYQDNGLTHAWLHSSLKISPTEQLNFLKGLVNNTLPVSASALSNTKQNMYIETLPNGYKLFGKTGSWSNGSEQLGWCIGYIQKNTQKYIFVLNFSAPANPQNSIPPGTTAKKMTEAILYQSKL